jgi:hypothetical protein
MFDSAPDGTAGSRIRPDRERTEDATMTSRERRTFFDRLCGMREAYEHLDDLDRAGITPICEAIADAERELELIAIEAESQPSVDPASSTQHPG